MKLEDILIQLSDHNMNNILVNLSDEKIEQMAEHLKTIDNQISDLKKIKDRVEILIIAAMNRAKFIRDAETGKIIMEDISYLGQESDKVGKYKITIKTDYRVSLDTKEYQIYKNLLRPEFNPVKEVTRFEVKKGVLKDVK